MEKTLIHAFEEGGVIHPPLEAGCGNCCYSETRIINIVGIAAIIGCYCETSDGFVDYQFLCNGYDLDFSKIPYEYEEEYERLEDAGELEDDEEAEAKKREIEEFLSL